MVRRHRQERRLAVATDEYGVRHLAQLQATMDGDAWLHAVVSTGCKGTSRAWRPNTNELVRDTPRIQYEGMTLSGFERVSLLSVAPTCLWCAASRKF